jgi:hypothetical protein
MPNLDEMLPKGVQESIEVQKIRIRAYYNSLRKADGTRSWRNWLFGIGVGLGVAAGLTAAVGLTHGAILAVPVSLGAAAGVALAGGAVAAYVRNRKVNQWNRDEKAALAEADAQNVEQEPEQEPVQEPPAPVHEPQAPAPVLAPAPAPVIERGPQEFVIGHGEGGFEEGRLPDKDLSVALTDGESISGQLVRKGGVFWLLDTERNGVRNGRAETSQLGETRLDLTALNAMGIGVGRLNRYDGNYINLHKNGDTWDITRDHAAERAAADEDLDPGYGTADEDRDSGYGTGEDERDYGHATEGGKRDSGYAAEHDEFDDFDGLDDHEQEHVPDDPSRAPVPAVDPAEKTQWMGELRTRLQSLSPEDAAEDLAHLTLYLKDPRVMNDVINQMYPEGEKRDKFKAIVDSVFDTKIVPDGENHQPYYNLMKKETALTADYIKGKDVEVLDTLRSDANKTAMNASLRNTLYGQGGGGRSFFDATTDLPAAAGVGVGVDPIAGMAARAFGQIRAIPNLPAAAATPAVRGIAADVNGLTPQLPFAVPDAHGSVYATPLRQSVRPASHQMTLTSGPPLTVAEQNETMAIALERCAIADDAGRMAPIGTVDHQLQYAIALARSLPAVRSPEEVNEFMSKTHFLTPSHQALWKLASVVHPATTIMHSGGSLNGAGIAIANNAVGAYAAPIEQQCIAESNLTTGAQFQEVNNAITTVGRFYGTNNLFKPVKTQGELFGKMKPLIEADPPNSLQTSVVSKLMNDVTSVSEGIAREFLKPLRAQNSEQLAHYLLHMGIKDTAKKTNIISAETANNDPSNFRLVYEGGVTQHLANLRDVATQRADTTPAMTRLLGIAISRSKWSAPKNLPTQPPSGLQELLADGQAKRLIGTPEEAQDRLNKNINPARTQTGQGFDFSTYVR